MSSGVRVMRHDVLFFLDIRRIPTMIVFRLLIPMTFLLIMSWSGFFINPKQLMPRFASAFISFLALQTFRTAVAHSMPQTIGPNTWMDVELFLIGSFMALAVITNVISSFLDFKFSEHVCSAFDTVSRRFFVLCGILSQVTMYIFVLFSYADTEWARKMND